MMCACLLHAFESSAVKHLASMLAKSVMCQASLGLVCLIILQQVVLVRVSGHVFN